MGIEPFADRGGLVSAVVVTHEVHVELLWNETVDLGQELLELDGPVATMEARDDRPVVGVERGEQAGGAVAQQVERWFADLTDDLLRRSDHRSVQALEKDIRAWVAAWNENPKPFIWTKTAEQILESLSRLLPRIHGGGH